MEIKSACLNSGESAQRQKQRHVRLQALTCISNLRVLLSRTHARTQAWPENENDNQSASGTRHSALRMVNCPCRP